MRVMFDMRVVASYDKDEFDEMIEQLSDDGFYVFEFRKFEDCSEEEHVLYHAVMMEGDDKEIEKRSLEEKVD